jgi:hypothetical protein
MVDKERCFYSNAASVTKTIAPTSTGNKRIDVLFFKHRILFKLLVSWNYRKPWTTNTIWNYWGNFCIVGDSGIETVEPINLVDYATIVGVDTKDVLLQ